MNFKYFKSISIFYFVIDFQKPNFYLKSVFILLISQKIILKTYFAGEIYCERQKIADSVSVACS